MLYVGQIDLGNVGRDGTPAVPYRGYTPETIIEKLKRWEADYPGLDQAMLHWAEGMPMAESRSSSAASRAT